jgi:alpha-mannosidase
VLSALKTADDGEGIVVRVFNPSARKVAGLLTLRLGVRRAWQSNLAEDKLQPAALSNGSIKIFAGPKQIVTLRLLLKAQQQ